MKRKTACKHCTTPTHTAKEFFSKIRKDDLKERSNKITELLISKPLCFNELVQQSGLDRKTVRNLLVHLLQANAITRTPEPSNGKKGRPRVSYSLKYQPKPQLSTYPEIKRDPNLKNLKLPSTVAVEVDFEKLRKACRHQKGGNCKEKIQKCTLSKCPLVLHIRLAEK